jgi:broad specificity phosphatase PhoE
VDRSPSAVTTLHLVRHGHVSNPDRILYGRLPGFHLSPHGRTQAKLLADHFAHVPLASVTASPLERAQETAEPIAAAHGLPVTADDLLLEATSLLEGMRGAFLPWVLRRPRLLLALRDVRRPSWGEPYAELAARVLAAMAAVRAAHPGTENVLVSHQAPIWVARLALERRSLVHYRRQAALASVTTVTYDGDRLAGIAYAEPAAIAISDVRTRR